MAPALRSRVKGRVTVTRDVPVLAAICSPLGRVGEAGQAAERRPFAAQGTALHEFQDGLLATRPQDGHAELAAHHEVEERREISAWRQTMLPLARRSRRPRCAARSRVRPDRQAGARFPRSSAARSSLIHHAPTVSPSGECVATPRWRRHRAAWTGATPRPYDRAKGGRLDRLTVNSYNCNYLPKKKDRETTS